MNAYIIVNIIFGAFSGILIYLLSHLFIYLLL